MSAPPEHLQALRLAEEIVHAETISNNPTLYPHLKPRDVDAAYRALDEHLIAHRAVLERLPEWELNYELIDTPDEPETKTPVFEMDEETDR
ncbi:hypothetical protein ACTD5D_41130 [Nocardia takedensis]|uniref:hypothetical protein n=1 Tax=Nocardia takedensis TaxID=259390 RepID=UPI003F76C86B